MTDVQVPSLDGQSFGGYLAAPDSGQGPVVLVIQEIFGVNAGLRAICDALAVQGYFAFAPDLFWRQEPNVRLSDKTEAEWARAMQLYQGFNVDLGLSDLIASLAFMRRYHGVSGPVGCVGYCLGGKLAYLMATRSDIDCAVSYYGVGLDEMLDEMVDIQRPTLMHIAGKDKFVGPEARTRIVEAAKANLYVEAHIYPDADHAFARPDGQHYRADDAILANRRTEEFLARALKR